MESFGCWEKESSSLVLVLVVGSGLHPSFQTLGVVMRVTSL